MVSLEFRSNKRLFVYLAVNEPSSYRAEVALPHSMLKTGVDPPQQRTTQIDGSLRAGLLAAIAANTAIIVVSGRPGLVPFVPINSLWLDRTHRDAYTAASAFCFVNNRPLGYPILKKYPESATGTRHWRRSIYFETSVDKGFQGSAHKLYILNMISP